MKDWILAVSYRYTKPYHVLFHNCVHEASPFLRNHSVYHKDSQEYCEGYWCVRTARGSWWCPVCGRHAPPEIQDCADLASAVPLNAKRDPMEYESAWNKEFQNQRY